MTYNVDSSHLMPPRLTVSFFFQAEDGIRDLIVNGVQTCALPIFDPEEAIRSYRHCVIVGDPGAGKTKLLHYLALKSAGRHLSGLPDVPVYFELNTLAQMESRSEERRVGKECRSRWSPYH